MCFTPTQIALGPTRPSFEALPEDSTVPVAERPEISLEILETPTGALETCGVRRTMMATMVILLLIYVHAHRQSPAIAVWMLRRGGLLFVIDPHDDNNTFSVETSQPQRAGQMGLVVNTNGSNEAPVSIAQCSDQTLALATVLASSLLDHGEGGLPRVDMSRFRPAKILDKRSGMSRV